MGGLGQEMALATPELAPTTSGNFYGVYEDMSHASSTNK